MSITFFIPKQFYSICISKKICNLITPFCDLERLFLFFLSCFLFLLLKPIPKINFTFTLFSANNLNSFAYSSIVSLETHGTIIQTSCLALVTPV